MIPAEKRVSILHIVSRVNRANYCLKAIESRVARIKARVAELTGNMEGTAAPQAAAPVRH